jgi:Tfp pilus assembly protein PilF
MTSEKKRVAALACSVVFFALFLTLSGCSKEAKMERHWKKGEQYFSENKPREAVLEYKNVLQLDPRHAKAHYKLGLTYLRLGMVREAYAAMSKTVEIDPGMIEARNQLGQLYLLSGDQKKAREQVDSVLAKDARNSAAHLLLSNISLTEKNLDQAIAESKKATEGEMKLEAYLHLANLYIMKKDLPQAEEMLKAAVKVDEKSLKARFALAEFYLRSGKRDLAEREYIEATRIARKKTQAPS